MSRGVNATDMKKMPARKDVDDMRPEYDFDYSKALP